MHTLVKATDHTIHLEGFLAESTKVRKNMTQLLSSQEYIQ